MKNIKVITKTGKTYTSELNQSKSINTPVSTWECNGIMMIDVITPNLDNGWFMPIAEIKLIEIDGIIVTASELPNELYTK